MRRYLDTLRECHDQIANEFTNSVGMPTLEEQRVLLEIAQTCIALSKTLTELRKIAKDIEIRA